MKRQSGGKISQKFSRSPIRQSHSEISTVEKSYGVHIPFDLTVDIVSKLPMKSLVRFRCVSKLWSYLINDSIKTRSLTQPRLLVIFHDELPQYSYFSSTYPQNPNRTFISADKESHTTTRGLNCNFVYRYVHGLIFCWSSPDQFAIYNPTTNQSVLLPEIKYDNRSNSIDGFFGYDPVENQYKVLCFIKGPIFGECSCQVFTLGSQKKQQWREINSQGNFARPDEHKFGQTSVCINGIIYYIGRSFRRVLGRFDVRFERFDHIQMPETLMIEFWDMTLVNYQGKFGCIGYTFDGSADMWIMEDHIEKQEWSNITLFMSSPDLVDSLFSRTFIAGVTRDGEIVIMPKTLDYAEMLYAYFHDPKQNKTRRVEFENTINGQLKYRMDVCIFSAPDHMENTMFLFRSQSLATRQFNKKKSATTLQLMYDDSRSTFLSTKKLLVTATTFRRGLCLCSTRSASFYLF